MKIIERASERGGGDFGWLKTRYSFSFANYYNPRRMGFGALRVLNDDTIEGGGGFETHAHDNMEIVTIMLEGALSHRDSTGASGTIRKGEVQVMSAGSGVEHSEFNASGNEKAKLLQIWINTKEEDIKPRYDQGAMKAGMNAFSIIASGGGGGLYIHQDATLRMGRFEKGGEARCRISKGNGLFIFMISGKAHANGEMLNDRDSMGVAGIEEIAIKALEDCEILAIEVPMEGEW